MYATFMAILMTIYRTERQLLYLSKLFSNFNIQIMFIVIIFFTFEIEYYGEMNNFLLKIMMEEFSLLLMLLCA